MPKRQQLGEFDLILIGAVFRGFTTGYTIRKQIVRNRGSRWSGSTGAVYPALRRLSAAGYLEVDQRTGHGARSRTVYRVTRKGREALRHWMMEIPPDDDLGLLSDPVRSRCLTLRMLKPHERAEVARRWLGANGAYLAYFRKLANEVRTTSDEFVALAFENVVELLKGRQRWLKKLAAASGRNDSD